MHTEREEHGRTPLSLTPPDGSRPSIFAFISIAIRFHANSPDSLGDILLLAHPDIVRLRLDPLQELLESHETAWSTYDVGV